MKVTTSDLLAILRRFRIANDGNVPRHIDQILNTNPSPINQLVRFRFNKQMYLVLFDETAQDDEKYIMDQIYSAKSDATGVLLMNPTTDVETHGLPFKGKDAYLYHCKSAKRRLDSILAERFADISRSTWQKYIRAGYVKVNGEVESTPKQEILETEMIESSIPDGTDFSDSTLPIIYIDDNVIVVNKPAGILTHTKGALNDEFTVADFFRRYTSVGLDTTRPGIVHRLDRDTSGLIIGARTPESFDILKSQFADRKAKKDYVAITDGHLKKDDARIDIPIGRDPKHPSTFRPNPNGKPSVTDYHVISRNDRMDLVQLHPLTGRTHQLRVHLAHLNTPIHGDRVYGKQADRLYLHAYKLEVTIAPEQRKTFIAPLPPEFTKLFPEATHELGL